MEDWFHSILEHLYKNHRLDDTNLDITLFLLTELKIPETDVTKSSQLRNVLKYLSGKKFIEWFDEKIINGAASFGIPHTLENHDIIETSVLKYHKIHAKLTLDGYNYFTERERLKQQHDSIVTTNNSVRETNTSIESLNTKTDIFYGKQKTYNTIQIILTIAIFLSSAIYTIVSVFSYNESKHSKESDQRLDKLEKHMESIKDSISIFKTDVRASLKKISEK